MDRKGSSIQILKSYEINNLRNSSKQCINLEELLSMEGFQGIRSFSEDNFDKVEIKNVTVLEDREFEVWLKGGELVLTTLQHFDTAEKQMRLIDSLVGKGVACLACHPGNISVTLYNESINYCKKNRLPILIIPKKIPYIDLFEAVYGTILNKQAVLLKQSDTIRKSLTDNILDGDDLRKIVLTVSNLIKNPVAVTDASLEPLVFNSPNDMGDNFHQNILQNIKEILNSNSEKMMENNICHYVLNNDSGIDILGIAYPIVLNNEVIRYLHVWEFNQSLKEVDFIALSHAATVIALDAMRDRIASETRERLTEDFINDLLENRIKNLESFQKRSEDLGLSLTQKRTIIVLNVKNFEHFYLKNYKKGEMFVQDFKKKLKKIIDEVLSTSKSQGYSVWRSGELIILPEVGNIIDAKKVGNKIIEVVNSNTNKTMMFSIGIGDICKNPLELHRSFQEAKEAIKIGEKINKRLPQKKALYCFSDLGVYQIFMGIMENNHYLKKFCEGRLQPIIDYEQNKAKDLLVTLETFLDCQQSFKETSQILYVHKNTVKYRIQKVEELLGYNPLKDSNESFNLHLAIKAYKIL